MMSTLYLLIAIYMYHAMLYYHSRDEVHVELKLQAMVASAIQQEGLSRL